MPRRIRYLYRGPRTWMLSMELPEDERRWSAHAIATRLSGAVDVETALQTAQAEYPDEEIRVLNWYRPKRDSSPLE